MNTLNKSDYKSSRSFIYTIGQTAWSGSTDSTLVVRSFSRSFRDKDDARNLVQSVIPTEEESKNFLFSMMPVLTNDTKGKESFSCGGFKPTAMDNLLNENLHT